MLPQLHLPHIHPAALLLFSATVVSALPHGDGHESMDMVGLKEAASAVATAPTSAATMSAGDTTHLMSYFRYQKYSGTILAHIILMAIAWVIILPVGMIFPVIATVQI